MKPIRVLVTGADQRQGLAIIRGLGLKGVSVCAAGLESSSLGFYSRYATAYFQYPSPNLDKKGFIQSIAQAIKQYRIPFVFPGVESTVIALDEFRDDFEGLTQLVFPSRESLRMALDKKVTLSLAKELDIPIPQTCLPESVGEILSFANEVGFPVVMKPRAKGSYSPVKGSLNFKVTYARDRTDLLSQLDQMPLDKGFPLIQEYCPGIKVDHGLLFAGNEFLGLYQYKGIREYPLTGGVTAVHVSEPVDSELKEWSGRLLKAMNWEGVAMVEYKVNEVSGKKTFMEVNGRFWAPQSASTQLGLNFPYALYRYVHEGVREKLPSDYPTGKRNRYVRGDLVALMGHLQGLNHDYLSPLPGKREALWNFLREFRPGVQFDVFDLHDPYPGVLELFSIIREIGRSMVRFYYRKLIKS